MIKGICNNSIKLLIKMINISRQKHFVARLDITIKEMNDIVLDNRYYYSLKGVHDYDLEQREEGEYAYESTYHYFSACFKNSVRTMKSEVPFLVGVLIGLIFRYYYFAQP